MKIFAAVASLLVLGSIQAPAQQPQPAPSQDEKVQLELLEIEQDVDKTLLREAMLTLGRKGQVRTPEVAQKREAAETDLLKDYIAEKKTAIIGRAADLQKLRAESSRVRRAPAALAQPPQRDGQAAKQERQELIEKAGAVQVDVQLLERQVQYHQQPLNEAVDALALAESEAANDQSKKAMADEARKQYDKAKSRHVDLSKKLQMEQEKLNTLQQQLNFGGMGGGMGGMGGMGGFR